MLTGDGSVVDVRFVVFWRISPDPDPTTGDTGVEQFLLDPYHDSTLVNLADPASGAPSLATLAFDPSEGDPAPGALRVTVPYSGANQYVVAFRTVSPGRDWTGKILHARVRVVEGTFTGFATPYVRTTAAYVYGGTATVLARNTCWQDVRLDLKHPETSNAGFDPAQVTSGGLQLTTGSAGAGAGPATFDIDSFWLE